MIFRKKECVAMLLAGGQGSRLYALTKKVAKPAVRFGGKYRIIDFPLSNCVNSGIDTVGVLTQYQPLVLNEYIGNGLPWDLDRSFGGVKILPPYQGQKSADWYKGTANAIYQNLAFINRYDADYVLILSGDHIYKMDYDKMLADYQAGGDLEALAEGNENANYAKVETGAYSGTVVTEWLFDEARKPGDSTVLTSGTAVYVAVFHDRFLEDYNTIDIRHILIQPEAGTLTAQDEGYEAEQENLKAAAKARAEEIYAQWKAGEATEDSFAELAKAESSDGSKYEGGLYTQVAQGQMVTAFNDWCFADGRKSGDNGIVETEYGYHIMYFVGENLPYWKTLVTYDLKTADYSEWETSLSADCTIDRGGMGMKFVR